MDKHPLKQTHQTHYYDGIEERDNPLPAWWRATFYLGIAFAAVYYVHYQLGSGKSIQQSYDESWHEFQEKVATQAASGGTVSAGMLEKLAKDPATLGQGKEVFTARCAVCHGPQGQGMIGPNLTDRFWLHGDGKADDIMKVVSEGVPAKGMPMWGSILSQKELQSVVAFVRSLRGTNPPNPKEPQGQEKKED